jgi:hypothetical protein
MQLRVFIRPAALAERSPSDRQPSPKGLHPTASPPMRKDFRPPKQPDLPAAALNPAAMLGWSPLDAIGGSLEGVRGFRGEP